MAPKSTKKFTMTTLGYWDWDENACGLVFKTTMGSDSRSTRQQTAEASAASCMTEGRRRTLLQGRGSDHTLSKLEADQSEAAVAGQPPAALKKGRGEWPPLILPPELQLRFRDNIDMVDELHFRRAYLRRCGPNEPDIVTLRDVKDVVLFLTTPRPPSEFLKLIHTQAADCFLRALIVYFKFFLKAHTEGQDQPLDKLPLPVVGVEERMRQDLSDLAAIVGREYCRLMAESARRATAAHLTNREKDSLSLRITEPLIRVSGRVVWVCLGRHHLSLVESEMDRLFRSDAFNTSARLQQAARGDVTRRHPPATTSCKLQARGTAFTELLTRREDFRTLSVGLTDWQPKDSRLDMLEMLLTCPEERLPVGCLGVLGRPRQQLDIMLQRTISRGEEESPSATGPELSVISLHLPPRADSDAIPPPPAAFPLEVPPLEPTHRDTVRHRKEACALWTAPSPSEDVEY